VVPEVDQHPRALAELEARQQRGSPVREVGRVERRLEELVLHEQLLLGGQLGVHAPERVQQPPAALAQVVLARVVRPVREPQGLRARAERRRDLHALEHVRHGLLAHARLRVRERAELVVGVLEEVRVHRADGQARGLDVRAQLRVVVDRVPREVQRHRPGRPREPVHLGGVLDALEHVARAPRLGKHAEAGPRVAVPPRRRLDDERAEGGGQVGHGVSSGSGHAAAGVARPVRSRKRR
jgi:hypothetical protein